MKIDTTPLSFFRFLNAIIIIYLHYGLVDPFIKSSARAGSIIIFFYMLSGFVLYLGYQSRGKIELKKYFFRRSISILPLYYVGFVLFAAILIYMNRFSIIGFLVSFFGIQAWIPHYQHYLNPPSWFVSGLLFFYLIFPLLFSYLQEKVRSAEKLLISSFVLWILTVLVVNVGFNPGYYSGYFLDYFPFIESFPLFNFSSFFMGVCGAYYVTHSEKKSFFDTELKSFLSTVLILMLFSLSLTIHYQKDISSFMKAYIPYEAGLYAPVILLLIINLSTQKNTLTRIFSLKIFVLLGMISYPLYILQAPLHSIYLKLSSFFIETSKGLEITGFLVFMIVTSILVTYLESITIKRFFAKK